MSTADGVPWSFGQDEFANAYTQVLVPRLFEPWAEALVDELSAQPASMAVDVACGPGTVTRILARRIGPAGRVVGIDVSPAMLAHARLGGRPPAAAPITWVQASADRLPVPDGIADTVTCQQGLQFFPDRDAAAAEWRRVSRPGARIGVTCWSDLERCRPYADLGRALEPVLGRETVERLQLPFHFGDAGDLGDLLRRHGFTDIEAAVRRRPLVMEEGLGMVWRWLGATPLAPALARIDDPALLAACRERLAASLRDLTDAGGAVHGEFSAAVVYARAG